MLACYSLDDGGEWLNGWLGWRLGASLRLGRLVRVVFELKPPWAPNVETK
jgi:hypothetical protein